MYFREKIKKKKWKENCNFLGSFLVDFFLSFHTQNNNNWLWGGFEERNQCCLGWRLLLSSSATGHEYQIYVFLIIFMKLFFSLYNFNRKAHECKVFRELLWFSLCSPHTHTKPPRLDDISFLTRIRSSFSCYFHVESIRCWNKTRTNKKKNQKLPFSLSSLSAPLSCVSTFQ